ncbi:MAG: hypothetical protein DWQ01_10225 [Planctomycetota bacterium]|nr:MAG: hypothetical protein DWQ01_10225 [Planctomycetota bacterium]
MTLVYAVHGVGLQKPGSVQRALETICSGLGIEADVKEFHWTNRGGHVPVDGWMTFRLAALNLSTINGSAFVETRENRPSHGDTILAKLAQLALYLLLLLSIWLPLLSFLFLLARPLTATTVSEIAWPAFPFATGLVVSATFAMISAIAGGARAIRLHRLGLFYGAIRRIVLLFLAPLLLVLAVLFVVPWSRSRKAIAGWVADLIPRNRSV